MDSLTAQYPPASAPETYESLPTAGADAIAAALTGVLADYFALYLKTKNFHWHMSGPHFRDYHLLLDEQSDQILEATDAIAERVRKIDRTTLRSVGHIVRLTRIADNDSADIGPRAMLSELLLDNKTIRAALRETHDICDEYGDVASASLIENWIDEAERRIWFLAETQKQP
jgi:starvation-inducible DNA-binding protein